MCVNVRLSVSMLVVNLYSHSCKTFNALKNVKVLCRVTQESNAHLSAKVESLEEKLVLLLIFICLTCMEMVQVTPLRRTLASSPYSKCASCHK